MGLTQIAEEVGNVAQIGLQTSGKTWNAIEVSQNGNGNGGVGDIGDFSLWIQDVTSGEDYKERDGLPFLIPFGHQVYGNYICKNIGDVPLSGSLLIEVVNPSGLVIVSKSKNFQNASPGTWINSESTGNFILELGMYVVYGRAEFDIA